MVDSSATNSEVLFPRPAALGWEQADSGPPDFRLRASLWISCVPLQKEQGNGGLKRVGGQQNYHLQSPIPGKIKFRTYFRDAISSFDGGRVARYPKSAL